VRPATAARLVLGGLCLAAPGRLLDAIGAPDRGDPRTWIIVRVLGGRLLAQGVADLALGARTRVPDIVIDATHAATMVAAAARRPDHRRSAMVSAALATGTAGLDLVAQPAP
jgi:hypothetical protein